MYVVFLHLWTPLECSQILKPRDLLNSKWGVMDFRGFQVVTNLQELKVSKSTSLSKLLGFRLG